MRTKAFYFNQLTNEQFIDLVNKELPIKLSKNVDLIDRVHAQYPLLSKSDIALIIKAVFESLREILIFGKTISFNDIITEVCFLFFSHYKKGKFYPSIKIQTSTPKHLRNYAE